MAEYSGKIELLNRAQAGDQNAVTDLFRQCRADIYFYAFEVLENEEAAKTVTRDTLYMMCREPSVPATEADFTPWMLYICHRCCKTYLPANVKREMPRPVAQPETDYVAVDAENNGVLPAAARDRLMAGLQVLSIEERAIIVLLYYENLPLKTAAQVMGYHPALAEAYRSQALRALKAAVMSGAAPGAMGGCSMKNTLWWIFSALHKNVKCDALPIYQNLCAAMGMTPSAEVMREIQGIHTVQQPVKQKELKMSLKDRIEWWPRPLKIGIVCVLIALVIGGGIFALSLLNDSDKKLETSEAVEEELPENTITTTKTAAVSTTKTTAPQQTLCQRDEFGNRIVNGTTAPTMTTKSYQQRTRAGYNGRTPGGNYNNNSGGNSGNGGGNSAGGNGGENLYRTTAGRQANGGGGNSGANGGNSGGNSGGNGGNSGGSAARPVPNHGGVGYADYRPATPTSNQGSKQTSGLSQGNFKYALYSSGKAHITGFTGSGSVSVPETLGGYTVTAIDPSAFKGTAVTSVTLPSSVEIIGDNAFQDCTSLTSVSMKGVVSIGMYSFDGCTRLSSVTVSNSLKRIGSSAFYKCSAMSSFTIPSSVISIEAQAFHACSSLSTVAIPSGVTMIEDNVFRNCSSLKSVTIPASVTQIGNGAFYGCSSLKTVYYGGTSAQWASLPFDEELNRPLVNATIVY